MDLRGYWAQVRDVEKAIAEPFVTVVSRKTRNGGRAGVRTVVARGVAARLVVDGKADLEKS